MTDTLPSSSLAHSQSRAVFVTPLQKVELDRERERGGGLTEGGVGGGAGVGWKIQSLAQFHIR